MNLHHLYKQYYLDFDKYNYILKERRISTEGRNVGSEVFDTLGYYGWNVDALLACLISLRTFENIKNKRFNKLVSDVETITTLKAKVRGYDRQN